MKAQLFQIKFALPTTIMACLALYLINTATTSYMWFYFPAFILLWWPLSLYMAKTKHIRTTSVIGAFLTISLLAADNLVHSSEYLWFLYTVLPILWIPFFVGAGKKAFSLPYAILSSASMGICYVALNIFYDHSHPWSVYVVFALILWPAGIYFLRAGKPLLLAITGSVLLSFYSVVINWITSPASIWAVYPIYACLWWILSVYYFKTKPEHLKKLKTAMQ